MRKLRLLITWSFALSVFISVPVLQDEPAPPNWNQDFPFEFVMDQLYIRANRTVADVGCANGFFTLDLAKRVGPKGMVYAVDINREAINRVWDRVVETRLYQIHVVHNIPTDPWLPDEEVDTVVIANAYHEFEYPDSMLQGIHKALKLNSRLAIIDRDDPSAAPREDGSRGHALTRQIAIKEATRNGFALLKDAKSPNPRPQTGFYFLIFYKRPPAGR